MEIDEGARKRPLNDSKEKMIKSFFGKKNIFSFYPVIVIEVGIVLYYFILVMLILSFL